MFNLFKKKKDNINLGSCNSFFENEFNKKLTDKLTIDEIKKIYSSDNMIANNDYVMIVFSRDNENLVQQDYNELSSIRDKINFIKAIHTANVILNSEDDYDYDPFIKNFILDEEDIIVKYGSSNDYFDIFSYVSLRLKNDKKFILPIMKTEGMILKYLPFEYKDNEDMVLLAINCEKYPGVSLKYASDRLKNNKEFVIKALYDSGHYFKYVSNDLINDVDFVYELICKYKMYGIFRCISCNKRLSKLIISKIKEDRVIDLAKYCLPFFPKYFEDDRDFVLRAVQDDGMLLKYASKRLRDDKEVVMNAVKLSHIYRGSCVPLEYASDRLKKDREIAAVAKKYAPLSYQVMDSSIRDEFM